jgi:hypothetical protein
LKIKIIILQMQNQGCSKTSSEWRTPSPPLLELLCFLPPSL